MKTYIYDVETYKHLFSCFLKNVETGLEFYFEISRRQNDLQNLLGFMRVLYESKSVMVGYNNYKFDYPILHGILDKVCKTPYEIYLKAQELISNEDDPIKLLPKIHYIKQIDLMRVNGFDRIDQRVSLKHIQFSLDVNNIIALPYNIEKELTEDEMEEIKLYNRNDVLSTFELYNRSLDAISFRSALSNLYSVDFSNKSSSSIGSDIFKLKLKANDIKLYEDGILKQSPRLSVRFKDVILPGFTFKDPALSCLHNDILGVDLQEGRTFSRTVELSNSIKLKFGLGGLHGSVKDKVYTTSDESVILDLDVSSFYPSIAIANNFYPEHLGSDFTRIYKNLFDQRMTYPKTSPESYALKEALNSVYGKAKSKFSFLYDPKYALEITLNGQLIIAKLLDELLTIDGLELIQANTDGCTIFVKRGELSLIESLCCEWEKRFQMKLEKVQFKKMFVKTNSDYIAEKMDGSTKLKGRYEVNRALNKDHSSRIVSIVAEKHLIKGADIRHQVENHKHDHDFTIMVKCNKDSKLVLGGVDEIQRVSRIYPSIDGLYLHVIRPPLSGKTENRVHAVLKDVRVSLCNNMSMFNRSNLNLEYFIKEVENLCAF